MKRLSIAVLVAIFCLVQSVPVPQLEESIDLVNIPLSNNKELDILTLAEKDGTINERNKRTIGILRELFPQLSKVRADEEENILEPSSAGTDAFLDTIRVARETNKLNNNQDNQINNNDQETQASEPVKDQQAQAAENSSSAVDELTLDSLDDEESRGKRFLNFGAASSGSNSAGGAPASGSAGGSGNFLFDVIRKTADRVARGAGSAYRVVAGTETLDEALKNFNSDVNAIESKADFNETREPRSGNFSSLVSGSSGTEQQDEKANAPDGSTDVGRGDGYTEGIPGPVTRLFVLANRGLSNLIQDLILRIAQTSERVVNFKARLITSLI